jgi:ammonium transporter, Amt family
MNGSLPSPLPVRSDISLGTIAGLVGITPAAGYVSPSSAFIIGISSGIACHFGIKIKHVFDFDDSLDAFGIHAIAGVVGGLLTGLLAHSHEAEGTFHGETKQIGIQIFGILVTMLWSIVGTALVFFVVDGLIGLRVSAQNEAHGLDLAQHGSTMTSQATKASRIGKKDEQNVCCQLHCPCFVFTLRHRNEEGNGL